MNSQLTSEFRIGRCVMDGTREFVRNWAPIFAAMMLFSTAPGIALRAMKDGIMGDALDQLANGELSSTALSFGFDVVSYIGVAATYLVVVNSARSTPVSIGQIVQRLRAAVGPVSIYAVLEQCIHEFAPDWIGIGIALVFWSFFLPAMPAMLQEGLGFMEGMRRGYQLTESKRFLVVGLIVGMTAIAISSMFLAEVVFEAVTGQSILDFALGPFLPFEDVFFRFVLGGWFTSCIGVAYVHLVLNHDGPSTVKVADVFD